MCKNCTSYSCYRKLVGVHISFNHFIMGSTTSSMRILTYDKEVDPSSKSMYLSLLVAYIFLFDCSSRSYHVNCLNISSMIGTNILRAVSYRYISL